MSNFVQVRHSDSVEGSISLTVMTGSANKEVGTGFSERFNIHISDIVSSKSITSPSHFVRNPDISKDGLGFVRGENAAVVRATKVEVSFETLD